MDDGWYDDQSYYEVEYYYDESDDDADIDYSRKRKIPEGEMSLLSSWMQAYIWGEEDGTVAFVRQ